MKLPLVDEIREARALAEESHLAGMHVHRIDGALTSVAVTEQQVRLRPELAITRPGDDVIELLAEHWPQLSDLGSHSSRGAEPVLHQLAVRRSQLELARQVLRPLASEGADRGRRLLELQHAQRHLLEHAEWSDDVAELSDLGLERDRLAVEITPLENRLAMVDPACAMLDIFVAKLQAEGQGSDTPDPSGVRAWRAAHLARTFVDSFRTALAHLKLEVQVPPAPTPPSVPAPELCDQLWDEVEHVRQLLADLRAALASEGEALRAERDVRRHRHAELTRLIVERMG